tara:strand:+ start:95 stop:388 length:294 start_codon:yes stop_codon:yes gene_type:complete
MENVEEKQTKAQRLKLQLKESLHEEISLSCQYHGPKTFTIGNFLDNQTVCIACKDKLPLWHADQLVHPVMTALSKMYLEEEKERKQAKAKSEKQVSA